VLLLGNAAQLFTRLVTTTDPEEACNIINKYIHSIDGKNKSILSGLAGVGYTLIWTQPHLQGTIKHQVDEWLTQIDNIIVDYCNTCLKAANYDYFTGLFGGLFYLLQRADSNTRLIANIESLIQGVSESIQTIDNLKVIESNKNVKNGIVEFGVAHGQAGYGAVLSHAISRGIAVQHSEKLFYQIWDTLNTVKGRRINNLPVCR
jgi:hypothetical protein